MRSIVWYSQRGVDIMTLPADPLDTVAQRKAALRDVLGSLFIENQTLDAASLRVWDRWARFDHARPTRLPLRRRDLRAPSRGPDRSARVVRHTLSWNQIRPHSLRLSLSNLGGVAVGNVGAAAFAASKRGRVRVISTACSGFEHGLSATRAILGFCKDSYRARLH